MIKAIELITLWKNIQIIPIKKLIENDNAKATKYINNYFQD
jgi:hypothetical protein